MAGARKRNLKFTIGLTLWNLTQLTSAVVITTQNPLLRKKTVYECGKVTKGLGNKITNGDRADPDEWPWMVALRRDVPFENSYCGGTLISDRHVLTAAHCIDSVLKELSEVILIMGETEFNISNETPSKVYKVESLEVHDDWNPSLNKNDIAILKTDRPVEMSDSIHPICLPTKSKSFTNEVATVIGFGATDVKGHIPSNFLLEVSLRILDNAECAKAYTEFEDKTVKLNHRFRIVETMLCAHGEDGKDSCQGDSGGPLNCFNESNKKWELCGIVSVGLGCGQIAFPGIYTRVTEYHDWIIKSIGSSPAATPNPASDLPTKPGEEVLIVRQDISGNPKYFSEANYLSLNKDNPSAKLYSRLEDLDSFRAKDGKLHFKLCYPTLTQPGSDPACFDFKQLSNPLDVTGPSQTVEGFELISRPNNYTDYEGQNFQGLRSDTRDKAFIDGCPYDWWWFAVAARQSWVTGIPGPFFNSSLGLQVPLLELYVLP